MFALATIALSLAVSVSSVAVPRATPPADWNVSLLEVRSSFLFPPVHRSSWIFTEL